MGFFVESLFLLLKDLFIQLLTGKEVCSQTRECATVVIRSQTRPVGSLVCLAATFVASWQNNKTHLQLDSVTIRVY